MHDIKPSILSSVVTTAVRMDRVVSMPVAVDDAYNSTHYMLILPKKDLESLVCGVPIKAIVTQQDFE